ncbi:hypothetical protein Celaphus_00013900 [Cervus elaphus hippelaphus]|uniref:DH domain-containing protein n=1 Tax=Cervus elaphus hippelaphus TaxID=46360 RepID=A0A212CC78_CEREH|nr:hypothetical protein Celaphus_00013900 [Cervus elaphus hippelaphus]
MQALGPPDKSPLQGLVASRIETYGGRYRASVVNPPGNVNTRGGLLLDPSRRLLQGYVPFTTGSGPARRLSPLRLREPVPEKTQGGLFGVGTPHSPKLKEVTKAHELQVRLHTFSMFGMPRLPREDRQHWEIGEGSDNSVAIEKSWKELVPGHKEMSRELCHQQEALWELLTTELIYVRKLKIMTDLLAAGLLNLQRVGLLTEVSAETLFGNVPSLIRAHRSFWEEVLGPTLEETRASGQPLDPVSLQDGFLTKRELLALYRDRDGESPSTRPSTPSQEGSQSSTEGRTCESSTVIPHLVVTEDTDEDAPSVPDDTSDSGYGTLIPGSPKESHSPLSRLRLRALRRDPRLTFSTLELRDVPLRPQPSDPQAPQRRSAPVLPEEGVRKAGSLPRVDPPTSSEEEDQTSVGENVVVGTLQRAQLRGQLSSSPTHADSSEESPWESSGDEEEEGYPSQGPDYTPSPHPLRPEDMLREIREELASQRIEGIPEPGDSRPRKLTRVQLQRMRGSHVLHLDTPLTTS